MALCPMGTTLTISGGNLAATLTVQATDITLPSVKRGAVEVTTLASPDNAKEFTLACWKPVTFHAVTFSQGLCRLW